MIGRAIEKVWNGETCDVCGRRLRRDSSSYDDNYFCSNKCLGEYLVEKLDDEIEWLDFITQEALDERMREMWNAE